MPAVGAILIAFFKGAIVWLDYGLIQDSMAGQIFAHWLAGDRHAVAVQFPGLEQFGHHGGDASGAVESLAQVFAGRLAID